VQEVHGLGGVRSGGEDRSTIFLKYLQPRIYVARVVVADFGRDVEVSTQEG
jgi:hypothetical protein